MSAETVGNFPRIAVLAVVQTPCYGIPGAVAPFYFGIIHKNSSFYNPAPAFLASPVKMTVALSPSAYHCVLSLAS